MAGKSDPILALAEQYGEAIRRNVRMDLAATNAAKPCDLGAVPAVAYRAASSMAFDEEEALRALISSRKATSIEGAAVQLALATGYLDTAKNLIPEDGPDAVHLEQDLRALERLIYSALAVVDGLAERKVSEIVDPIIGNDHCSPWRVID